MGMTKKEYIDQLIVDEIAEKVANEPMEDMIDELDSDMGSLNVSSHSVPEHVWVENKVDDTRQRMKELEQIRMYDDDMWNWSGLR